MSTKVLTLNIILKLSLSELQYRHAHRVLEKSTEPIGGFTEIRTKYDIIV